MLPSRARARDVSSRLSNQRQWPIPRQTGELGYPYRHGRRRRPIRVRNGGDASWGRSFCSGALFQRDNRRPSTGLLNSAGDWQALDTNTKVTSASTRDPPIRTRVAPPATIHTRARACAERVHARAHGTRARARARTHNARSAHRRNALRGSREMHARTHLLVYARRWLPTMACTCTPRYTAPLRCGVTCSQRLFMCRACSHSSAMRSSTQSRATRSSCKRGATPILSQFTSVCPTSVHDALEEAHAMHLAEEARDGAAAAIPRCDG